MGLCRTGRACKFRGSSKRHGKTPPLRKLPSWQNTSVAKVAVVPSEIGNDKADAVASIVQSLRGVVEFYIQPIERNEGDLPVVDTVDRLLYGIVHNPICELTHFRTVYSVGFEVMTPLSTRFPAIKVSELGYSNMPCNVSESFALACIKTFTCQPNLETEYLHARCSQPDLSRLLSGLHGSRALQSLTVDFFREHVEVSRLLQEMAVLGTSLPKLTTMLLGCPDSYVSIEPFLSVPGYLSPSLTRLTFDSCNFPDLSVFTVSTRSSLSGIAFQELSRRQFPLGNGYSVDEDGLCPWRALRTNAELKRLCHAIVDHPTLRAVSFALGCSNHFYPAMQSLLCNVTGLDSIELRFTGLAWVNLDLLARALQPTHLELKHLSLDSMYSHWNDSDYGLILRALCTNPSLEKFELCWGEHDPSLGTLEQCALTLCDALVANTALKRLRLSGVPAEALTGVFDQLLAGLMVHRTLREVTVERVEPWTPGPLPSPRFGDRLVELLEHNAVLCKIRGFGAFATTHNRPGTVARATFFLELNLHGRRALMPGGDIPAGCWPAVLGRMAAGGACGSDGDPPSEETTAAPPSAVLHHFLRAKPELIRTSNDDDVDRHDL